MPVESWMVYVALTGLVLEIVGFFPCFFYSMLAIVRSILRWKQELVLQLDHDLGQLRSLSAEIAQYPTTSIVEHFNFTRDPRSRMATKFAFLFGGIDRLGILPVAVAVALQVKLVGDLSSVSSWLILLAAIFALFYVIALIASQHQIRLQLYEMVLAQAIDRKKNEAIDVQP